MRKFFAVVISSCMLVGLAACGGDEKVIGQDQNKVEATKAPEKEENKDAEQEKKSNGYVFTNNGLAMEVDADAAAYVSQLGEAVSYYESPSCAFDNLDKFYTYHGFEIDTYYMNGKDLVLGIVLLDDTVSTTEGICIGDTQEKVTSAYGTPTETTDNSATYKKDNMKLVFIFKDGVVAAIEYKSLVLDVE